MAAGFLIVEALDRLDVAACRELFTEYQQVLRYNDNPIAGTRFMALDLRASG